MIAENPTSWPSNTVAKRERFTNHKVSRNRSSTFVGDYLGELQIRPGTVSSSGGVTTISTDLVRLWPSQITGQVGSIGMMNGTFTLTGLSPLFTGATPPITTINVVTLSGMDFLDFPGSNSLNVGQTVSVKGLLFKTTGTPTLVPRTMRDHNER
jgi:hypothetical protein